MVLTSMTGFFFLFIFKVTIIKTTSFWYYLNLNIKNSTRLLLIQPPSSFPVPSLPLHSSLSRTLKWILGSIVLAFSVIGLPIIIAKSLPKHKSPPITLLPSTKYSSSSMPRNVSYYVLALKVLIIKLISFLFFLYILIYLFPTK